MRLVRATIAGILAAALAWWNVSVAQATETCGNGADDDADNLTDEGCYPTGITGVCENPLGCSRAGAVAPVTGGLVWTVPADIAPAVAYGPPLVFQRFYTSLYEPGYSLPSSTDYKAPLGYQWQHNYMSWIERTDSGGTPDYAILHTVTGQDIFCDYTSSDATYYFYTEQAGHHFDYLRQNKTSGAWELRTLSGWVYVYDWNNPVGKLTKIKDSVGEALAISYNGDGQVYRVDDATGRKRLEFSYLGSAPKLLDTVAYRTDESGGGTFATKFTVDFDYTASKELELVKYDGTIHAKHTYTGGYLTKIQNGDTGSQQEVTTEASFKYASAVSGQVVLIETPDGDVGYTYGATGCDSGNGTVVTYHRNSILAACDRDYDMTNECGMGYFCGGETDPSANNTGTCFKVERCLTLNTAGNDDLIDAVSATSCPSCVETKDYVWDTTNLEVDGKKSADDVWTTYRYNADGMVTKMVEGDNNSSVSDAPATARVTYYIYGNSSFPGRVTEVRRLSQLKPGGTCDDPEGQNPSAADCKRTIYTYTSGGQLDTIQQIGFTKSNTGSVTGYNFTTDYTYDTKGRVTKFQGPRSGDDDIDYTYHTGAGYGQDYLHERKRKKGASSFITTDYDEYDMWGNAGRVTQPNGGFACLTYHGDYNRLTTRRQVIDPNGTQSQDDCGDTDSGGDDETTSFQYDRSRRMTHRTRPKGNWDQYTYDTEGRLKTVKQVDSGGSAGDTTNYFFDEEQSVVLEGLVTKIEWKDSSGSITRKQQYTYYTDRRLEKVINPVSVSYHKLWSYDYDGVPAEVQHEDYGSSSARTQWDVDDLNRTTKIRRYTGSTSNEEWSLTQAAQHLGLPTEVADDASHDIDNEWDDLGRQVTQIVEEGGTAGSPNITRMVYDEASNLVEKVEADGAADEQSTTYTYDTLNRLTAIDTGDADCFTLGGAEIQYTYDALPGGVSCPSGSTCTKLSGHLAYVKTLMWCDNAKSDDMFDQATFYSYDQAGRTTEHTVLDDGGRKARVPYTYDKNSNNTQIDYPSGSSTAAVYTFGSGTADSDDDKIYWVKRNTTSIAGYVRWNPYGPLKSYYQYSHYWYWMPSYYRPLVTFTRNVAYRLENLKVATTHGDNVFMIDYDEDVRGRYTERNFSYGTSAQKDMYFVYDNLSRITCRWPTSARTCSGTTVGYELATYNNSGDRSSYKWDNGTLFDNLAFTPGYANGSGTTDELATYTWNASYPWNYTHDTLGRRTSDDDTYFYWNPPTYPDYDKRTYTYDGRNNLITIQGKYQVSGSDWNPYTITYAYDEKNRLIFKSFLDEDLNDEAQWFFYWDQFDRLIEAKYTPDIDTSSTYQVFQWYWIKNRPFIYYQIDYPAATTTRRYLESDEQGRPLAAWSSALPPTQVWEVNPGLFGWDPVTVGASIYQPLRFPGQLYDEDSEARAYYAGAAYTLRPGITYNRFRSYDSLTGGYLQVDPLVDGTWDAYGYAGRNPVTTRIAVEPPVSSAAPLDTFHVPGCTTVKNFKIFTPDCTRWCYDPFDAVDVVGPVDESGPFDLVGDMVSNGRGNGMSGPVGRIVCYEACIEGYYDCQCENTHSCEGDSDFWECDGCPQPEIGVLPVVDGFNVVSTGESAGHCCSNGATCDSITSCMRTDPGGDPGGGLP